MPLVQICDRVECFNTAPVNGKWLNVDGYLLCSARCGVLYFGGTWSEDRVEAALTEIEQGEVPNLSHLSVGERIEVLERSDFARSVFAQLVRDEELDVIVEPGEVETDQDTEVIGRVRRGE